MRDIVDQNSKAEAREFINRLSEVYRFILESGNADLISLADELKFAEAYIHIQQERFSTNLKVHWHIADFEKERLIIPMSLQLLLENAVKHNVISKAKPLDIEVRVEAGYLIVSNTLQPKSTHLPSTKLGLKNIKDRYVLISDKEIRITKTDCRFTVQIPLLTHHDQKKLYAHTHY